MQQNVSMTFVVYNMLPPIMTFVLFLLMHLPISLYLKIIHLQLLHNFPELIILAPGASRFFEMKRKINSIDYLISLEQNK